MKCEKGIEIWTVEFLRAAPHFQSHMVVFSSAVGDGKTDLPLYHVVTCFVNKYKEGYFRRRLVRIKSQTYQILLTGLQKLHIFYWPLGGNWGKVKNWEVWLSILGSWVMVVMVYNIIWNVNGFYMLWNSHILFVFLPESLNTLEFFSSLTKFKSHPFYY